MDFLDTSTPFGSRVSKRLESDVVAWLTTTGRATGTPQPSVVWFLRSGPELLILSQPDKPKLRNIEVQPRVAFHLNSDELGGGFAVLTGTARLDPNGMSDEEWAAYVAKYQEDIPRVGHTPESFIATFSELIRVTPEKVRGF